MARDGIKDIEVVAATTKLDTATKGAFVRNLYIQDNAWTTRPGFGQMAQFDTTLSLVDPTTKAQGLRTHLGSKAMYTDFDHVQILSCFLDRAFTGEELSTGIWTTLLSVHIYDVTTNEHHEEVLFRHTAENNPAVSPMPNWRGVYETASDLDLQSWVAASDSAMFFTEFNDHLFFGSPRVGLWVYNPADFSGQRRKQVNSSRQSTWSLPYSESSLIVRLNPVPGNFEGRFDYVTSAEFPMAPSAVAAVAGRLVYSQGRDVFFSDQGLPGSILADNIITITSEANITALQSVGDALLIFTEHETFHYQLSVGDTVSLGRLTRISPDVGCLSASSICTVGEAAFWVDVNGCYTNNGGLQSQRVSDNVGPFFESHFTDPLSQYLTAQGTTNLEDEQPRLTYRLSPTRVSCVYDPVLQHVLVAVPDLNLLLLWNVPTQAWSICPVESCASGSVASPTPGVVGRQSNLPNPWVVVANQRVFLLAGPEDFSLVDEITGEAVNSITGSYIVTEWGRGGGLDRSVDALEDNREFTGFYTKTVQALSQGEFFVDEPIRLPDDYQFPGGIPGSASYPNGVVASDVWLVPVQLRPNSTVAYPAFMTLRLTFDNTKWAPVTRSALDPVIEVILPPERGGSNEGWGLGALGPVAAVAECQVYTAGVADPVGNEIRLSWDTGVATARKAYSYAAMNAPEDHVSTLLYVPMKLLNPATDSLGSFGFTVTVATVNASPMDVFIFDKAVVGTSVMHHDDDVAQPVDYAFKSAQVGVEEDTRLMYRGCFIRVRTQGQADDPIFPDNPWKTLNIVVGSDWNSWTSQVVTFQGGGAEEAALKFVLDKLPIRSRVKNVAADRVSPRTFANSDNVWGDSTNSQAGNFLIDEVEVDTLAVSDAVKGQTFDIMVFGMIRSRAESLTLDSIKVSLRNVIGGRRREGR
jgi:hypothetical protein